MPYETSLVLTLAAGLVLAFVFGTIANRLRLPALMGYVVAGLLVGPHTPGFPATPAFATALAEFGVVLVMFGVGLRFRLEDLTRIGPTAIAGAAAQAGVAGLLGLLVGIVMGWGVAGGLVFGLALSAASGPVLFGLLGRAEGPAEREAEGLARGWLVAAGFGMVLVLVLVSALAGLGGGIVVHDPFLSLVERLTGRPAGLFGVLGVSLLKLAAFAGFMLVVGRSLVPLVLRAAGRHASRELFRLAVPAIALALAFGAAVLFAVPLALGALLAGVILAGSGTGARAGRQALPLRDAFTVLFFLGLGMTFDPGLVFAHPIALAATILIVLAARPAAAFALLTVSGRPPALALRLAAGLAPVAEFAFILASLGVALALLPTEGRDLILAGAVISILLGPVAFALIALAGPGLMEEAPEATRPDPIAPITPIPARSDPVLDHPEPVVPRLQPVVLPETREGAEPARAEPVAPLPEAPQASPVEAEPVEPVLVSEPEPLPTEPEAPQEPEPPLSEPELLPPSEPLLPEPEVPHELEPPLPEPELPVSEPPPPEPEPPAPEPEPPLPTEPAEPETPARKPPEPVPPVEESPLPGQTEKEPESGTPEVKSEPRS